jgi:hypothetical protein
VPHAVQFVFLNYGKVRILYSLFFIHHYHLSFVLGEELFAGDDGRVFTVTLHSALAVVEILVWKFQDADLAYLPVPLTFANKLKVCNLLSLNTLPSCH